MGLGFTLTLANCATNKKYKKKPLVEVLKLDPVLIQF
jgi:hypothetical protein